MSSNSFNSFSFISIVILLLYSTIESGSGLGRKPSTAYQALFKKDAGSDKTEYAGPYYFKNITTGSDKPDYTAKADTDRDATYQEPVAPVVPVYDTPTYEDGKPGKLNLPSLDKLLDPSNEAMHVMTSLVLGVFNLIAYIAMDSRVASITRDQDNVCNTIRPAGNLNLAVANTAGASSTLNAASINTVITSLNNLATPNC